MKEIDSANIVSLSAIEFKARKNIFSFYFDQRKAAKFDQRQISQTGSHHLLFSEEITNVQNFLLTINLTGTQNFILEL